MLRINQGNIKISLNFRIPKMSKNWITNPKINPRLENPKIRSKIIEIEFQFCVPNNGVISDTSGFSGP